MVDVNHKKRKFAFVYMNHASQLFNLTWDISKEFFSLQLKHVHSSSDMWIYLYLAN